MNNKHMTNEKLLDEVEEYLANHGTVHNVQFSEVAYLHRIKTMRAEIKHVEGKDEKPATHQPKLAPVSGVDIIPEITDLLGRHWEQPKRENIKILDGRAYLDREDFARLSSYDSSIPSGVYPGKMWKRTNAGVSWLCWFAKEVDRKCEIHRLPITVVQNIEIEA